MNDKERPEWVPKNGGNEYTTRVMKGVESKHDGMPGSHKNKQRSIKRKTATTRLYSGHFE